MTALALMRLLEQAGGLVQCDKMLLQRRSREVIELSEQEALAKCAMFAVRIWR